MKGLWLAIALPFIVSCSVQPDGPVTTMSCQDKVTVVKLPLVVTTTYFGKNDRAPGMVLPSHNQSANTNWQFRCKSHFDYDVVEKKALNAGQWFAKLKITSARIEISAPITIWLPSGANQEVIAHENGHVKICRKIYDSEGLEAASTAGCSVIAKEFSGTGKDLKDACQVALNDAGQAVGRPYRLGTVESVNKLSQAYDMFAVQRPEPKYVDASIAAAFKLKEGAALQPIAVPKIPPAADPDRRPK